MCTSIAGIARNYQGTSLKGVADRPIGAVRTAESHIIVLDSTLPVGVNGIMKEAVSRAVKERNLRITAIAAGQKDKN